MNAVSLLALGLGLGSAIPDAEAAPSTPPPPNARNNTPPPPGNSSANPFLPTQPGSTGGTARSPSPSPTPPPPTAPPPPSGNQPPPGVDGPQTELEPPPPPQDLSHTWGYSKSSSLKPRYVRANDPTLAAPNPVGFYSGVSLQGNHVPPLPAKKLGQTPAKMTWTGFERTETGSRVFFQLSAEAAHELNTSKNGLVLKLRIRNTRVNVKNNRRRLDLRYFKTPVREVKVRHKGRDTVATIHLKRTASPSVRIIDSNAGYKLLVVDFTHAGPERPSPPAS